MNKIKRISECPKSPNCVSTLTQQKNKRLEPIAYKGSLKEVKVIIKNLVEAQARVKLVVEEGNYLHFVFKSKVFGFKDDVEFLIDEENKLIHFKSASRVGYGDMGANKKRMNLLKKELIKVL